MLPASIASKNSQWDFGRRGGSLHLSYDPALPFSAPDLKFAIEEARSQLTNNATM